MEALFTYQTEGAYFLASKTGALLFDDMGLGKTAQAIRGCDLADAKNVLVICPAAAKINWEREFRKFQNKKRPTAILSKSKDRINPEGVIIANYDLVIRKPIYNQLMVCRWDVVILDEAHFLKNPKTARTKAVFGNQCSGRNAIISGALRRWALTGTPVPNNPGELWPILRALTPEAILYNGAPLTFWQFLMRYCVMVETTFGMKVVKGRNLIELKKRMQPFMLRRKKEDVLKDLPPIRYSEVVLDAGTRLKELTQLEKDEVLDEFKQRFDKAKSDEERLKLMERVDEKVKLKLRRFTGLAKAFAAVELVSDELAGGLDKIVLMCWHRTVFDVLKTILTTKGFKVVGINGETTPKERQQAIDSFQEDPETRVFIGQIQAAGTAITLTAASNLMFVESSWTPADNAQAAMRVHRIGQENSVLIRFASLAGSIDEAITSVLKRKMAIINQLFN